MNTVKNKPIAILKPKFNPVKILFFGLTNFMLRFYIPSPIIQMILILILYIFILIAAIGGFVDDSEIFAGILTTTVAAVITFPFLVFSFFIAKKRIDTAKWCVYTDKIEIEEYYFFKKQNYILNFDDIRSVYIQDALAGRIFNLGSVVLVPKNLLKTYHILHNIENHKLVCAKLSRLIEIFTEKKQETILEQKLKNILN